VGQADVVLDFSHVSATLQVAKICASAGKSLIIGTTGHAADLKKQIQAEVKGIPFLMASNFSVGVNALFYLAQKTAEILGSSFDVEIVEAHHKHKKDAPSGTAKSIVEAIQKAQGSNRNDVVYGRSGDVGERSASQLGVHAVRGGSIVGDHTVVFAGEGEVIELCHYAQSREIFAFGALRAAAWIASQKAGIYSMADVLGLKF
jgi:4-hydroxy-tetrahydrodipicolinate reductase